MVADKSIFDQYPCVATSEHTYSGPIGTLIGKIAQFGSVEEVPHIDGIPRDFHDPEFQISDRATAQRAELDAIVGRRINNLGRGVGLVALSFSPVIINELSDKPIADNWVGVTFSLAVFMAGLVRAHSLGRIDSIHQIHQLESNVRRPDNFIRLMFSKNWYERARNRQEAKRHKKLQLKVNSKTIDQSE